MLNVAIVEDNEGDRALLQRFIQKYKQETGENFRVFEFSDGLSFLSKDDVGFNIVFMDIEMPGPDGMKTAKKLRAVDRNASIIFVTNMAKYAVNGYEVDALDFLVKPADYFSFSLKFEKAVRLQKKLADNIHILQLEEGLRKLVVSDILFVESSLHYVVYYLDDEEIRVRSSMKETELRLANKDFVRCNNSYLINLERVERVKGNEVVVGGHVLPISRSRKKQFLDALAVYYRGY